MKCLGSCFQVLTFILGTAFPLQAGFDHFHENLPLIHMQKDSWKAMLKHFTQKMPNGRLYLHT